MSTEQRTDTTISLVRHADAVPEMDAQIDPEGYDALGLSVRGAAQAEALARRLFATTALDAIYASPTRRARETAEPVAAAFRLQLSLDERLREVGMPVVTLHHLAAGERAAAVRAQLALFGKTAMRDGTWTALAQTEPPQHVRARMRALIGDLQRRHHGGRVLAVSHAGTINAYFAELLGLTRDFFFPTGNTSISTLRIARHGPMVVRLNDTAHLERPLDTT